LVVLERGWLSANGFLFVDGQDNCLVDTGYHTHGAQTVALVRGALKGQALHRIVNTHLHSDHCGGNAHLQAAFPGVRTLIPPGDFDAVREWNEDRLSYRPTGQRCDRFRVDAKLEPGHSIVLAGLPWEIHAAPGHDTHSIILFQPAHRLLISADALWQSGFGVVFPEIEGQQAFSEVAATLDLIERLQPAWIFPGHGAPFQDVQAALTLARRRLAGFEQSPTRHALHAAKVLVKFKLLELQSVPEQDLRAWALGVPHLRTLWHSHFCRKLQGMNADDEIWQWLRVEVIESLIQAQAALRTPQGQILNL
jgi:glyoxylase-like metal-dependent hydrolase (beta-lactamase superfamily II)